MRINIVSFLCLVFYFENSQQESHQRFFPRDFFESISIFKQRNASRFVEDGDSFEQMKIVNSAPHVQALMNSVDKVNEVESSLPNVTQPCLEQFLAFSEALGKKELWALKIVDAIGKPTSGILQGSLLWLGEYGECVNTTVESIEFQGKYCRIAKPTQAAIEITIGICIPKQCTNEDAAQLVNLVIDHIPKTVTHFFPFHHIDASYLSCQEERHLDAPAILAIVVISMISVLVITATVYDFIQEYMKSVKLNAIVDCEVSVTDHNVERYFSFEQKERLIQLDHDENEAYGFKVLKSFSFYTNAKKVFHISKNDDQLKCLHAIRFLSLSWVILGHTYAFGVSITDNILFEDDWLRRYSFQIVIGAYFAVDGFFVLSGLLTCYMFLKEAEKINNSISAPFLLKYYIHRFWRITPTYAVLLMILTTLTRYFGDGPIYPSKDGFEMNMCRGTWFLNLLYVNNLIKAESMCYGITWYLANDMQFHWIAPIMLIPFALKKPRIGFVMSGLLLCASVVSIGLILNNHPGAEQGGFGPQSETYRTLVYNTPWCRIGPFIIGVILGYLIFKEKSKEEPEKLDERINFFGWAFSILLCSILVFALHPDFVGHTLSKTAHIFYQCFSRTVWGLAISFMIYSCVTKSSKLVNSILSWSVWIPLSRLTYSAYLVHQIVIIYFYATKERPYHLQDQTMIYNYIPNVVISYACAFVISTFIEIPFINLEKFLFKWKK